MTNRKLLAAAAALLASISVVACDGSDDNNYPYYPSGTSGGTSGTSGSPSSSANASEHPEWLVGPAWTKGYKTENNIAFESDDKGIKFGGAPNYDVEEKVGKQWTKSGTWKLQYGSIQLTKGGSISVSSMKANCKILQYNGTTLYTSEKVEGCPDKKPLTSSECAKVGYYSKSTESGSSSSSYGTSKTYVLDPDGVITFTSGTFQSTCYSTTCKSLSSSTAPTVGKWYLSGSSVMSDTGSIDLTGFNFQPNADADCGK